MRALRDGRSTLPHLVVVSDPEDDRFGKEGVVSGVAPLDGVEHWLVSFTLAMSMEQLSRMSKLEHPALWFRPEQLSEVER
jgi:hypothetical protein